MSSAAALGLDFDPHSIGWLDDDGAIHAPAFNAASGERIDRLDDVAKDSKRRDGLDRTHDRHDRHGSSEQVKRSGKRLRSEAATVSLLDEAAPILLASTQSELDNSLLSAESVTAGPWWSLAVDGAMTQGQSEHQQTNSGSAAVTGSNPAQAASWQTAVWENVTANVVTSGPHDQRAYRFPQELNPDNPSDPHDTKHFTVTTAGALGIPGLPADQKVIGFDDHDHAPVADFNDGYFRVWAATADLSISGLADDRDDPAGPNEVDPGAFLMLNDNDSDSNGVPDNEQIRPAASDPELLPVSLNYGAATAMNGSTVGLMLAGNTLRVWENKGGVLELVVDGDPSTSANGIRIWTVGDASDPIPTTLYVEGVLPSASPRNTSLVLAVREGNSVASDEIRFTVESRTNLTAYRPRHGADYAPFLKSAVDEIDEDSTLRGPGIRINNPGDNDAVEDDLIEVTIRRGVHDGDLALRRGSANLKVYTDPAGLNEIPFTGNKTAALTFSQGVNERTVFVEWAGASHGTANLVIEPVNVLAPIDTLTFHTFKTAVHVLGGENQPPRLPRDNSMNDQGIFVMADPWYYKQGYDVYLWDEDNVSNTGAGAVYDAIVTGVTNRSVENLVLVGYSHGGGSVYDVADRLTTNGFHDIIAFTSYVDAIENDSDVDRDSEVRRPPGSAYHVNDWQPNPTPTIGGLPLTEVNGAPTTGADRNSEYPSDNHNTIDNNPTVHQAIRTSFNGRSIPR